MNEHPIEIVEPVERGLAVANDPSAEVGLMIRAAIENKLSVEAMEKLFALYERMAAIKAQRAYSVAMAQFQAECPAIPKTRSPQGHVRKDGTKGEYSWADLDTILATITPSLAANCLYFRWSDSTVDDKGIVRQACTVTHADGHYETSYVAFPSELKLGMSPAQKVAAAGTYARRYSLIAVLGLRNCEPDDDGAGGGDVKLIEETAAKAMDAALDGLGEAMKAKFLKYWELAKVADMPADRVERAWEDVKKKQKQAAAQ